MEFTKVELDDDLVLMLPVEEGENYGIDNLKVIASFAGRAAGKTRRYAKDGKLSFLEKIGIMQMVTKTFKEGKTLDFNQVNLELRDLNAEEYKDLNNLAVNNYLNALKEDEAVDGAAIIDDFVQVGLSVYSWVKNRVENKMAA